MQASHKRCLQTGRKVTIKPSPAVKLFQITSGRFRVLRVTSGQFGSQETHHTSSGHFGSIRVTLGPARPAQAWPCQSWPPASCTAATRLLSANSRGDLDNAVVARVVPASAAPAGSLILPAFTALAVPHVLVAVLIWCAPSRPDPPNKTSHNTLHAYCV